jgi:hypothetical protein
MTENLASEIKPNNIKKGTTEHLQVVHKELATNVEDYYE